MNCRKCAVPLDETNTTVMASIAPHDEGFVDVVVGCDACGHAMNDFVKLENMTDMEVKS